MQKVASQTLPAAPAGAKIFELTDHHSRGAAVDAGGDKILAHAHPSRMPRNHSGIDTGLIGHVFQKPGSLS
jgi:hypothetical protein